MGMFFLAVVDGFGRLVELAPGAPEIHSDVDQNELNDWLLVGGDLRTAITDHPDLKAHNESDSRRTDEELVEA